MVYLFLTFLLLSLCGCTRPNVRKFPLRMEQLPRRFDERGPKFTRAYYFGPNPIQQDESEPIVSVGDSTTFSDVKMEFIMSKEQLLFKQTSIPSGETTVVSTVTWVDDMSLSIRVMPGYESVMDIFVFSPSGKYTERLTRPRYLPSRSSYICISISRDRQYLSFLYNNAQNIMMDRPYEMEYEHLFETGSLFCAQVT